MTSPAPSASWYRLVLDSVAELVIVMDGAGHLVWANRTTSLVLGVDPAAEVGRNVLDWVHPDDLEEAARLLVLSLEQGYAWPIDVRVRHADGSYITMAVSDIDAMDDSRSQFVLTLRRVQTPRVASATDGQLSPLAVGLHHVSDAVVAVGSEGQVVFRNRAAIDLFRIGAARVMAPIPTGVVLEPVDQPPAAAAYREPFARVRAGEKVPRHEVRLVFPDGWERLVEITGEPLIGSGGEVSGCVVAFRDVTELRRQEAELRQLALRDALTGLANRTELMAHLRTMLADCLLHGGHVVVMFVDLDHFKDVNDTFDHLVGDEVLQVTAQRLVGCVGPKGLVARFGGEEFVVVSVLDSSEADVLARTIVEQVREPMLTQAGMLSTSCSVGLASGGGATEPEQLLREADTAVYAAKRSGGATVAWYDRSQRERAVHRIRAVREARALADLVEQVRYRPVFDLTTGAVVAFRSVVPDVMRVTLSAQSWVDRRQVLEFVDHTCTLDRLVREKLGPSAPPVLCPLPTPALAQRALLGEIDEVLSAHDQPIGRRIIDVVTVEAGVAIETQVLAGYGSAGIQLVVDDPRVLLTATLTEIPLDLWAVRIPRDLVGRLRDGDRDEDRHAVRALAELAAAHGAPLAADRLETDAQRQLVVELGATLAWGDLFGPAGALEDVLTICQS